MKPMLVTAIFVSGIFVSAGSLTSASAYGQGKSEFESRYNTNFLKRSSLLGKDAPNVEVYDEDGNGFRLAQSRGKHTVVVFGCLT